MRALFFHGNRDLQFSEIPQIEPGPGEIRLNITDAGLSQATIAEFIDGPFIGNLEDHPRTNIALPIIPCQEFGGVIDRVGPGVDTTLIGKTGAVLPALPCGTCATCEAGRDNLCETLAYRGLVGAHGGFVEQTVIPQADFFETTDNIQPNLVEPLLVALHAAKRLKKANEESPIRNPVLIMGAGCIGICLASILKNAYKIPVLITDPLKNRLALANCEGFDTCSHSEVLARQNTFDWVVDAAGKDPGREQQPLYQAIDLCSAGGTIIAIGTYFTTLEIQPANFLFQEISIVSSLAYDRSDVTELKNIQQRLTTNFRAFTTKVAFENLIDESYDIAELDRRSTFTRIITSPAEVNSTRITA